MSQERFKINVSLMRFDANEAKKAINIDSIQDSNDFKSNYLMQASKLELPDMIEHILTLPIDINAENQYQENAFDWCIAFFNEKDLMSSTKKRQNSFLVAKLLLDKKIKINQMSLDRIKDSRFKELNPEFCLYFEKYLTLSELKLF